MMMSKSNTSKAPKQVQLPPSWAPSSMDVICGRGSIALQHEGNKRLKALVKSLIPQYNASKCKFQKSTLVSSIVASVQQASPGGGFVKFVEDGWVRVSERHAREKVGQIFRDSLSGKYKSSTRAKSQKRREKMAGSGDDSSRGSASSMRCDSPSSLGPHNMSSNNQNMGASASCFQQPQHIPALPLPLPHQFPPSVINVNNSSNNNNNNMNAASSTSSLFPQQPRAIPQQMALIGDIEPLPVESPEAISLDNIFDSDFVSEESVSFLQSLTEKNIDELCDIIFDECL